MLGVLLKWAIVIRRSGQNKLEKSQKNQHFVYRERNLKRREENGNPGRWEVGGVGTGLR
jgi:hypothetical protein